MTGREAMRKYGIPFDAISTPINEKTLFESNHMTLWDIPKNINKAIRVLPNRLYCNKDLVQPLTNAFNNIIERGLAEEIKTWDGCYNPRPIRGVEAQFHELFNKGLYDKAADYISIHSWGLAIDINAAWNQLGKVPLMSQNLVKCFADAGFTWGGTFIRKDGMHFELK
jgi:hypothetical protein